MKLGERRILDMIDYDACDFSRRPFLVRCHGHGNIGAVVSMVCDLGSFKDDGCGNCSTSKIPSGKGRFQGLLYYGPEDFLHGPRFSQFCHPSQGFTEAGGKGSVVRG